MVASGLVLAQDAKSTARLETRKASDPAQKTGGVVTKVEPLGKSDDSARKSRGVRLTIKTDAVWRDWVRDQATAKPTESTEKAAAKGRESIATKGQPSSPDSSVVIDVVDDTKLETRFRAASDEANSGSATPKEAVAKEENEGKSDTSRKGSDAKAPKLAASDLKPGLWVEVNYAHDGKAESNRASSVVVLRPVGGPQSPPKDRSSRRSDKPR